MENQSARYQLREMQPTALLVPDPTEQTMTAATHYLTFTPETGRLVIVRVYNAEHGTIPSEVHYGHTLRWLIPTTVDAQELAARINTGAIDLYLDRIRAGYKRHWNGHNHVGRYSKDAEQAQINVTEWLVDLPIIVDDNAGLWEAREWYAGIGDQAAIAEHLAITPDLSDEDLEQIVTHEETQARVMDAVVLVGTLEYLQEIRAEISARTEGAE